MKKRTRWVLLTIGIFFSAGVVFFLLAITVSPPAVNDNSCLSVVRENPAENTYMVGNNWLRKSESGLWEMYIEGDPFERGVAFGKLTKELLFYQESAFVEQIQKLVPSKRYLKFLKYFTAWFNRDLDDNIPDEYKLEIYGTSFSCSPMFDFIGSGYQRQLNYHAAHDIGHALQGLNMVGCTSFSCWGQKSSDSTLLVARNFDFFAGEKFAENKIVCFYKPSTGYKFMMISWADMIGVVSGMNEKGLTVTINASKSSIPFKAFSPVTLLAREILQYAVNIAQADSIAQKRKLFVSESILIGSVKDGRSAIIEKSPDEQDMVVNDANQIVCANHFQGEKFRNNKINRENINGSDSKYRFDRVGELLQNDEKVGISEAVSILRNRMGTHNSNLGMGNPLSINQLIAHHAIVFKPARQLVWVSAAPWQLGKFVAYDLNKVFSLKKEQIIRKEEICISELEIPADTFLSSAGYSNYRKYLKMTGEIKEFTKDRSILPGFFEEDYIHSNPDLFLTYVNLGEYHLKMKKYETANQYFRTALQKEIAGKDQKAKISALVKETQNRIHHAHSEN
jgi:isopenicillin-N N-acyltransferase like protein